MGSASVDATIAVSFAGADDVPAGADFDDELFELTSEVEHDATANAAANATLSTRTDIFIG
jgi:hypothetical protein